MRRPKVKWRSSLRSDTSAEIRDPCPRMPPYLSHIIQKVLHPLEPLTLNNTNTQCRIKLWDKRKIWRLVFVPWQAWFNKPWLAQGRKAAGLTGELVSSRQESSWSDWRINQNDCVPEDGQVAWYLHPVWWERPGSACCWWWTAPGPGSARAEQAWPGSPRRFLHNSHIEAVEKKNSITHNVLEVF